MGEQKHTDGPWEVRGKPKAGPFRDGFYIAKDAVSHAVAHVRLEPDARLIAAAPDMLTELKQLLRRFENCARSAGNGDDVIADATATTRAAIAKASTDENKV